MKRILLITLLLPLLSVGQNKTSSGKKSPDSLLAAHADGPSFQLLERDLCDNSMEPDPWYCLQKGTPPPGANWGEVHIGDYESDGFVLDTLQGMPGDCNSPTNPEAIIYLHDTGWYRLSFCSQAIYFHITENKLYCYRSVKSRITAWDYSTCWRYYDCARPCQGKTVHFYPSGAVRMIGNFKNGYPKGKLFHFKATGGIEIVEIYSKRTLRRTIYDWQGKVPKP